MEFFLKFKITQPWRLVLWSQKLWKARKFTQELLSLFTAAKTGEQPVRIDLQRLLSEETDLLLFKNGNYAKTKHGNNKQNVTRMLFDVLMLWCVWNVQFYILVWSFSIQVNGREISNIPLFTVTCNLGESILIFIEHADYCILSHFLNLVKHSL